MFGNWPSCRETRLLFLREQTAWGTMCMVWTALRDGLAAATLEGEFSDVTRSYAGKGVVRYAW
jgi:hypothetical protein